VIRIEIVCSETDETQTIMNLQPGDLMVQQIPPGFWAVVIPPAVSPADDEASEGIGEDSP
jgi:hypothetical protein